MKALKVFFVLGLTLILVACGIFNKTKRIEKARVKKEKTEIVVEQKGITVHQKQLDTEFTELVIRMPKEKAPDLEGDSLVHRYESLQSAIVEAIRNSETTTLRTRTTHELEGSKVDTGKTKNTLTQSFDSLKQETDLKKQSNTTMASNIPWFAWIIGMAIGFLLIFLVLKRYKVL